MIVSMTYNPNCGTARNVLAILRERGIEPQIIEYFKTPLTRTEIAALVKQMNVPVRDVMRTKEALYSEFKLENTSDDQLLDAMAKHPPSGSVWRRDSGWLSSINPHRCGPAQPANCDDAEGREVVQAE